MKVLGRTVDQCMETNGYSFKHYVRIFFTRIFSGAMIREDKNRAGDMCAEECYIVSNCGIELEVYRFREPMRVINETRLVDTYFFALGHDEDLDFERARQEFAQRYNLGTVLTAASAEFVRALSFYMVDALSDS